MKFASNKALVLGGLYLSLSLIIIPLPESLSNIIDDALFVGFVLLMMALAANRKLEFLERILSRYPKTGVYLTSVGWIPYIELLILMPTLVYQLYFGGNVFIPLNVMIFVAFNITALIGSLAYATYKVFKTKP